MPTAPPEKPKALTEAQSVRATRPDIGLFLSQFQHQPIRDLAWAIGGAPLLTPAGEAIIWPDHHWYSSQLADYLPRLKELDSNPDPLTTVLGELKDFRLGAYFEALLGFWLSDPANACFQLLAHHLPVQEGKRTLGEFDFLVSNRHTGLVEHWEVAVRFYLGTATHENHEGWIGMDPRDRLDRKFQRLVSHQLPLSQSEAGLRLLDARGLSVGARRCVLKGRLFYPCAGTSLPPPEFAASRHERGRWSSVDSFMANPWPETAITWALLPRHARLAPIFSTPPELRALPLDEFTEYLTTIHPLRTPAAIAGFDRDGRELGRGFLVPPNWPNNSGTNLDECAGKSTPLCE